MVRLPGLAAVVAAMSALTVAGMAAPAAAAVDADCLWSVVPDKARAGMIDGYRAKGLAVLGSVNIDEEIALAFSTRCGVTMTEGGLAGEQLGTMILTNGADQVLFERNGLKKGSLDKAWRALSAADRQTLGGDRHDPGGQFRPAGRRPDHRRRCRPAWPPP
ncbi:MAG: hypothetical protein GC145_09435 [Caulobacter sp.]|nr:hypothetical protein [Caulobacter sp.]